MSRTPGEKSFCTSREIRGGVDSSLGSIDTYVALLKNGEAAGELGSGLPSRKDLFRLAAFSLARKGSSDDWEKGPEG
jgi:hypothetical protein